MKRYVANGWTTQKEHKKERTPKTRKTLQLQNRKLLKNPLTSETSETFQTSQKILAGENTSIFRQKIIR